MKKKTTMALGGLGVGGGGVVIRVPPPRLLRLLARSVLIAAVVVSFPWIRTLILRRGGAHQSPSTSRAIAEELYLPILLADLRHRGLLRHGAAAAFLGDAGSWLPFLRRSGIAPIPGYRGGAAALLGEGSLDFVLSAEGAASLASIDGAIRVGGVAAVLVGSEPFRAPENYRIAFERRVGPAVVAVRKIGAASASAGGRRRLMAVAEEAKKEALNGLEDVLLEPPGRRRRLRRRPRYLPELTGDSLEGYRRRVFVEVAPRGSGGSAAAWFERHYPRGKREFEIIRVEEVAAADAAKEGGMAEWLERNVREEDYVVVKAEAEVAEEVVRRGRSAIGLVDELFLECRNQWESDKAKETRTRSRRAYWECLALYGRLRDQGVAVHQWWGSS